MNYIKYTFYLLLLGLMAVSCDVFSENSEKFPLDIKSLTASENTGAFVRVINKEGSTWNLFDITNQEYTVTLEVDDAENGGQLESLTFTVGYSDNAAAVIGDLPQSDVIRTIPASDFETNQTSGLPRVTTTFSANEFIDALGIDPADLGINAAFTLRWTVHMTDGKSFNDQNSGLNITGGAFFNSPFAENITLSLQIPEDQFVGDYTIEQNTGSGGVIGVFGDSWMFGAPGDTPTVTLEVDPDNTLNGRIFTGIDYLDSINFNIDFPIRFALSFNPLTNQEVTFLSGNSPVGGISCNEQIFVGPPSDISLNGTWDSNDDSQFTLTIIDDVTEDCGLGQGTYTFTLTKQ